MPEIGAMFYVEQAEIHLLMECSTWNTGNYQNGSGEKISHFTARNSSLATLDNENLPEYSRTYSTFTVFVLGVWSLDKNQQDVRSSCYNVRGETHKFHTTLKIGGKLIPSSKDHL
jgi:hypothetical protein